MGVDEHPLAAHRRTSRRGLRRTMGPPGQSRGRRPWRSRPDRVPTRGVGRAAGARRRMWHRTRRHRAVATGICGGRDGRRRADARGSPGQGSEMCWLSGDLSELDAVTTELFDVVALAGNVMIFLEPGTERRVVAQVAARLAPGAAVVAGFSITPGR